MNAVTRWRRSWRSCWRGDMVLDGRKPGDAGGG